MFFLSMLKCVFFIDVNSLQLSRNVEADADSSVWAAKYGDCNRHISPYKVATVQ